MKRRALLSSLGVCGISCLAGCSATATEEPPTGSVRFSNQHDLPHVVGFTITDIGTETARSSESSVVTGDTRLSLPIHKQDLTTSVSIAPSETVLYPDIFSKQAQKPIYYAVEFTVDGSVPKEGGRIPYSPAPTTDERYILSVDITESGSLSPEIVRTTNEGGFPSQ